MLYVYGNYEIYETTFLQLKMGPKSIVHVG